MQVWTRVFITGTYVLIFTICNDSQALIAVYIIAFFNLEVIQMPIFCSPAVAVVNFDMTTGYFKNSAGSRCGDPEIGSIHSNIYT